MQMPILVAPHTPRILIIVEIVRIIHLLDRLNPLSQKAADAAVFPLALLTEASSWGVALTDDVPPLVALIADCPLRASVAAVGSGQAVEAEIVVQTGVVVVPDLLASETSDIALEVSEQFNLLLRTLVLVMSYLHWSPLLVCVIHLHNQIRDLRPSGLLGAEEAVCVDWS